MKTIFAFAVALLFAIPAYAGSDTFDLARAIESESDTCYSGGVLMPQTACRSSETDEEKLERIRTEGGGDGNEGDDDSGDSY